MAKASFTAVYRKSGRQYIGWIAELPGANTQAGTLRELKENLQEAATLTIAANRAISSAKTGGAVKHEQILVSI